MMSDHNQQQMNNQLPSERYELLRETRIEKRRRQKREREIKIQRMAKISQKTKETKAHHFPYQFVTWQDDVIKTLCRRGAQLIIKHLTHFLFKKKTKEEAFFLFFVASSSSSEVEKKLS